MSGRSLPTHSSRSLRAEINARSAASAELVPHEVTFGRIGSVVYGFDESGAHGNFLQASLRRILADPRWSRRLEKAYTGVHQLPRAADRRRGELECAVSSDALLMNLFCYPGTLRRRGVCAALGVEAGLRPSFGVRVALPMHKGEIDRTELDMRVGDLLVEAKLTESGFGKATLERLLRYRSVEETFDVGRLPRQGTGIRGYQIVRGLLAAQRHGLSYMVLLDRRRADLHEACLQVMSAVLDSEAKSRFRLLAWQELAVGLPPVLKSYLHERFGIEAG